MLNFEYYNPTRIVFGRNRIKVLDRLVPAEARVLVLYGGGSAEKHGTRHARPSALDGIPKHLPALMRVEKLLKKARRAGLFQPVKNTRLTRAAAARQLFELAAATHARGWSPENLLRAEARRKERDFRKRERLAKTSQ